MDGVAMTTAVLPLACDGWTTDAHTNAQPFWTVSIDDTVAHQVIQKGNKFLTWAKMIYTE